MTDDRLERLEPEQPTQEPAEPGLPRLGSFAHLEIGAMIPPPAAPAPASEDVSCPRCGQANEKQRDTCWACYAVLPKKAAPAAAAPPPPQDITLVLDGRTYQSADPALPEDIRVLMRRIQEEGYSRKLLADWRGWRATRNAGWQNPRTPEGEEMKGVKIPSRSVIRLDGNLYRSDDPNLPAKIKPLFDYLGANGVTPALMDHLRRCGDKVKFRPDTTAAPSDGCVDFWTQVNGSKDQDWSPDFPVPEAPWGVRVEREAGALRITRRWLCLGTLRPLLALWAIVIFLGFCWIPMHRGDPHFFLLLVAVLGAAPAYMTAARFVNRSVLRVDAERLTVRHGPLPGWGSLDIPTRDIGRVSTGEELVRTRSGNFMSYEVALTRKDGEELPILSEGELSSDQAAFIARQLEDYLGAANSSTK